jgi:hypothetical protein
MIISQQSCQLLVLAKAEDFIVLHICVLQLHFACNAHNKFVQASATCEIQKLLPLVLSQGEDSGIRCFEVIGRDRLQVDMLSTSLGEDGQ